MDGWSDSTSASRQIRGLTLARCRQDASAPSMEPALNLWRLLLTAVTDAVGNPALRIRRSQLVLPRKRIELPPYRFENQDTSNEASLVGESPIRAAGMTGFVGPSIPFGGQGLGDGVKGTIRRAPFLNRCV